MAMMRNITPLGMKGLLTEWNAIQCNQLYVLLLLRFRIRSLHCHSLDIFPLLAHLSRRLIWWVYRIGRPPSSVVRRTPSSSTLFKHVLLRNHWANQSQISYGASMGWENYSLLKLSSPETKNKNKNKNKTKKKQKNKKKKKKKRWPWILVCIIGCSSTTKFAQMISLGWPWPTLWQGQLWSLMLLYGKKGKTMYICIF